MVIVLWIFDTLIDTLRGVFRCFLLDFHGLSCMKLECGVCSVSVKVPGEERNCRHFVLCVIE